MFDINAIANRLIECQDESRMLPPITSQEPEFDVAAAYDVLGAIIAKRKAQGWRPVGRKIGFTNRTIWPRYDVYQPMWAHTWAHSVHFATEQRATLPLAGLVQPRIEPEVVFKLRARPPGADDPVVLLDAIEWIAAGFEIVQSHFPLVIGAPLALSDSNRETLALSLASFELTLIRDDALVDRGVGSNVLGSPLNALAYLIGVLATQPQFAPLAPGEVITTGTITDAWPVRAGETWRSDYGALGVEGLALTFA